MIKEKIKIRYNQWLEKRESKFIFITNIFWTFIYNFFLILWILVKIFTFDFPYFISQEGASNLYYFYVTIFTFLPFGILMVLRICFNIIRVKEKGYKKDITSREGLLLFIANIVIILGCSIYFFKVFPSHSKFTHPLYDIYFPIYVTFSIVSLIFIFIGIFYFFKKK